jgi:hypothetical protein
VLSFLPPHGQVAEPFTDKPGGHASYWRPPRYTHWPLRSHTRSHATSSETRHARLHTATTSSAANLRSERASAKSSPTASTRRGK